MRIFVTIITVAFVAHWTFSDVVAWAPLGNAVHSLLSAEERVYHYF